MSAPSVESLDIRQLVERVLDGDQASMRQLVDRYRGRVFALCYRMLGHLQDAEDTVQETFLRVAKSLSRWDAARDFEPWLLAIAGNRCRTMLAKRCRRPTHQPLIEQATHETNQAHAADALAEEVHRALAELNENHRRAFTLFHEQELSYAEISQRLDRPLGTVKTWVHRARRELIERLRQRDVIGGAEHAMPPV